MKYLSGFTLSYLLILLFAGCQTYAPTNSVRTITFSAKLKADQVLEAAIDAARETKLPSATKIDKANGVVEFGGFSMPELGLAAQVRIKSETQVEITVKKGSMFVPIKAESETDSFKSKLEEKLAALEQAAK